MRGHGKCPFLLMRKCAIMKKEYLEWRGKSMREKRILITLFLVLASTTYASTIEGRAEEVEIDLNTNTLTSEEGVILKQSNMKTKVHTIQRDPEKGMSYYRDGVIGQIDSPTGMMKIESESGEANSTTKESNFYNNFGYLEVSAVTGAEAPNDRIYFGSDHIQYREDKVFINRAWTTTDFKAINHFKNPKEIDYHILSKQMVVEPDKQLTVYDSNLYLGNRKILPTEFPWFRLNIRSGSKVPLFPTWGEKTYYGSHISWGVLYGERKGKFRGGIAPKFADNMGWMLGRWETWYDSKKYGETQINVNDLMLYSKVKNKREQVEEIEYEQKHRRYQLETKHDYSGEYGSFHFLGNNSTTSMVSSLNDLITKYEANGEFNNASGIQGTGVFLKRPHFDKNIGFYTLSSDLKGMGENHDISLQGKLKLTTNKDLYTLSVYDDVEDNVLESKKDNALYTDLALYQENKKYKIGGYYSYLHDITPGYTTKYTRSKGEDFGFTVLDREKELGVQYDESRGDQLRTLHLWELESNAGVLKRQNPLKLPMDYTPVAVSKYRQADKKQLSFSLGNYKYGNYVVKPSFVSKWSEKKLDLLENEAIQIKDLAPGSSTSYVARPDYERFIQYNRFENEIYAKEKENKFNLHLYEEGNLSSNFFAGNNQEEFLVRDGQIGKTESPIFIKSESNFYGMDFEKKNIDLGNLGKLALRGDVRYDDYKHREGSSWKWGAGLGHEVTLYEEKNTKVSNNLDLYVQRYEYEGRKEEDKAYNLYTKKDSYQIKDTLSWDTKAVHTKYQGEYQLDQNPYARKEKKGEFLKQKIDFQFAEKKQIGFFYQQDERYTNRIITGEKAYKDLGMENYGTHLQYEGHGFDYQRQNVNFTPNTEANEKIKADSFRYSYAWDDKQIGFYYRTGKDRIYFEDFREPKVLDIDNKVYGVSFQKTGDIQHSASVNYEDSHHREGSSKVNLEGKRENIGHTDSIHFSYQYRDTRLTDSEYIQYASLETGKSGEQVSIQDIEKIKSILSDRNSMEDSFRMTGIREDAFLFGDNRTNFRFYGTLKRNKARYQKTHNVQDSLEKIKGGIFYTYNRYGLGYTFEQNAGWLQDATGYRWAKKNREHQISLYGKVGKPSNGWKVKTYAKFYENLLDKVNEDQKKKKSLDGIGIEIGKEFGFYEWSTFYEKAYSLTSRDYEWRVGIQFTLLAFPENSLFGVSRKKTPTATSMRTEFMKSADLENIVDDSLETKKIMKK